MEGGREGGKGEAVLTSERMALGSELNPSMATLDKFLNSLNRIFLICRIEIRMGFSRDVIRIINNMSIGST